MESPSADTARRARKFPIRKQLERLRRRQRALIYTHDNPDPDSLAAAWGLAKVFRHVLGLDSTIAHGGIVGRAQNRAMVDNLGIKLTSTEKLNADQFDLIALLDSQPETGNNSLPVGHRIDVVIDHHPPRPESRRASWCDIRPDLGATSTIVFEYLRDLRITIDPALATAFFFALRTETRDLGREATAKERHAYLALVPLVDHALLYRMSHPKVPRAHFAALDRALRSAEIHGNIVAVNLGRLGYPDLVAEIADLLLSYDQAKLVLCAGHYDGSAYLSLRAEPTQRRAGSLMRTIVGTSGAAGGHGTMAGARLFKTIRSARTLDVEFKRLVAKLCDVTNQTDGPESRLLASGRSNFLSGAGEET
ncbi:MAG: DHH family phosphoesterase [Deltaproteobacteria bacterium]|nr:DHH family phosphoesterase [Deltaproteobacteria bacterium]